MNRAQRELKKHVTESMSVDKVTCRADGTVELRRHYFYRQGCTDARPIPILATGRLFLAVVAQVVGSDNSVGDVCVPRRVRR